jgi:putative endonuclease
MLKEFHVYILLCSDGTYYTGMTSNLENRMFQHENAEFPRAKYQPFILYGQLL